MSEESANNNRLPAVVNVPYDQLPEEYGDPVNEDAVRAQVLGALVGKARVEVVAAMLTDPLTGFQFNINRFRKVFRKEIEYGFELARAQVEGRLYEAIMTTPVIKASLHKTAMEWLSRRAPYGKEVEGWASAPKRVAVQTNITGEIDVKHTAEVKEQVGNLRALIDKASGVMRDVKRDLEAERLDKLRAELGGEPARKASVAPDNPGPSDKRPQRLDPIGF